jgi:hypothetical protein
MDLSIIITSFNTKKLLTDCISSIKKHTKGIDYEIIVIDNASSDGSAEAAKSLGAKIIKNSKNLGFAKANNQGVKAAIGKFILFLNTDTLIDTNLLSEMVDWMNKNEKVGVASCALKNKDGSIQATGGYFPTLIRVFSWMTIQDFPLVDKVIKPFHPLHSKSGFSRGEDFYASKKELDWVTGAFLLTRNDVLGEVGGWDETFFMYVEETELCFRIKKEGYKVWYLPKWSITHFGGGSSKTNERSLISEYEGIKKFYKKHFAAWQFVFLRLFLKIGALGRIVLFGILEGRQTAKIYAKAFKIA